MISICQGMTTNKISLYHNYEWYPVGGHMDVHLPFATLQHFDKTAVQTGHGIILLNFKCMIVDQNVLIHNWLFQTFCVLRIWLKILTRHMVCNWDLLQGAWIQPITSKLIIYNKLLKASFQVKYKFLIFCAIFR